jgi:cytochrome c556
MTITRIVLLAILAGTATVACAAPEASDPAPMIAGRQATFRLSGAVMGSMKAAIDRGDDVAGQTFAANTLANWARVMPGMFPAGSGVAPSKALATIWSDRPGFEKAAADYQSAAAKLAGLAKAGDKPGFAAQWTELRKTCGACHDHYRQPDTH